MPTRPDDQPRHARRTRAGVVTRAGRVLGAGVIAFGALVLAGLAGRDHGQRETTYFPGRPDSNGEQVDVAAMPSDLGGDPAKGRQYLLHGDYIGAGIPLDLWKRLRAGRPAGGMLQREGVDATVPDDMNQYRTPRGAEVVSGVNCLGCHASTFRGELVIGIGNSLRDWPPGSTGTGPMNMLGGLMYRAGSPERASLTTFLRGAAALDNKAWTPMRGVNPAFRFEQVAAAHRHPDDLSWSSRPLFEYGDEPVWSDVPAWWGVRKKRSLYFNGMGHGEHARLIQQIGVVMIDDASDMERTLPSMRDVLAYIRTLRPPKHPGPIDADLVKRGADVFAARCADCHGTYGEQETYPNRVIPVEDVGTDPTYARRVRTSGLPEWFNKSWFAAAGSAYATATEGYIAPPLDGVWCTAPYFHNGSVPTLEGVLNSRLRPDRWTRSFDDADYDTDQPGWRFVAIPDDFVGPMPRSVYDTGLPGAGNRGHTYGDDLSDAERRALIEYLKTL